MNDKYKNLEDGLLIGVDFNENDKNTLAVFRKEDEDLIVVNMITDDEALEIYKKLIGE